MKTSLTEFIAHVKKVGIPTATHFFVYVPGFQQYELCMCDSTSLPGIQLMSSEVRMFGELTTLPHAPLYQTHQMTFIADNTMAIRNRLEEWLNQVYNQKTRHIGYYDDYTKNISIYLTDKAGNVIYAVSLMEAWIQSIPGCSTCQRDFRKLIKDHPPRYTDWHRWTFEIHNIVNQKLGKPEFTWKEACKKYNWHDLTADIHPA